MWSLAAYIIYINKMSILDNYFFKNKNKIYIIIIL